MTRWKIPTNLKSNIYFVSIKNVGNFEASHASFLGGVSNDFVFDRGYSVTQPFKIGCILTCHLLTGDFQQNSGDLGGTYVGSG